MDKENVVYSYRKVLFNLKKEINPAVCDTTGPPGGYYVSEISK